MSPYHAIFTLTDTLIVYLKVLKISALMSNTKFIAHINLVYDMRADIFLTF